MKRMPFEMIDFVAKGAGQQALAAHFIGFALHILRADGHIRRTQHIAAKSGQRKASFLFALVAFDVDDLGIGKHELRFGILPDADVDDRQPFRQADLRRGQAHALRHIHRLEHVLAKLGEFVVEFLHGLWSESPARPRRIL